MTWFGWLLVGSWALSFTVLVRDVGQPRKPLTPGLAAAIFVLYAVLAVAVLTVGTGTGV